MKLKVKDNIISEFLEDTAIVIKEKNGLDLSKTIVFEGTAFDIWNLLVTKKVSSLKVLTEEMLKIYNSDEKTMEKDLINFIDQLKEQELIECEWWIRKNND